MAFSKAQIEILRKGAAKLRMRCDEVVQRAERLGEGPTPNDDTVNEHSFTVALMATCQLAQKIMDAMEMSRGADDILHNVDSALGTVSK